MDPKSCAGRVCLVVSRNGRKIFSGFSFTVWLILFQLFQFLKIFFIRIFYLFEFSYFLFCLLHFLINRVRTLESRHLACSIPKEVWMMALEYTSKWEIHFSAVSIPPRRWPLLLACLQTIRINLEEKLGAKPLCLPLPCSILSKSGGPEPIGLIEFCTFVVNGCDWNYCRCWYNVTNACFM